MVAKPFARSGGSFFSVITLFRYFPVIILGLRLAELTALGQVATPRELPPAAAREVATWIANQPRWSISAEAETSLGFKDNLLLSAKAPEASAFARSSWEALVLAVLASSVIGLTVDSVVFLWLAFGSLDFLLGQVLGKMWMVVFSLPFIALLRRRDERVAPVLAGLRAWAVLARRLEPGDLGDRRLPVARAVRQALARD